MDDLLLGFICVVISALFYGSYFVVIKPFDTRDGFFVYWVQSVAIFIEGFVVALIIKFVDGVFPQFSWYALLAGFLWGTANTVAVPLINEIGMGIGLLIWTTIQIFIGWASARFGWFGLDPQRSGNDVLEIVGVVITLASGFMFAVVQSSGGPKTRLSTDEEKDEQPRSASNSILADNQQTVYTLPQIATVPAPVQPETKSTKKWLANHFTRNKVLAMAAAVFSGFMYGLQMTPVTYAETKLPQNETYTSGIYYAFPYFTGILITNTFWFLVYAVVLKRNKPYINMKTTVPGLIYGLMWAIATTAWLISDDKLSQAISYPLTSRLPGVVAALWSVLFFKEITGRRNIILLTIAVVTACIGVVLVSLAKATA